MKRIYFFLLMAALMVAFGCGNASKKDKNTPENTLAQEEKSAASNVGDEMYKFKITTKYGTMSGILYNETPIHRDNFIKLISEGFYDGLLFHRVINGFMIQGGDPESKNAAANVQLGNGGPGYTLQAEINPQFIHKKGALAAARTADQFNPQRASSGSQFYIVQGTPVSQETLDNLVSQGYPYTETQMAIYKKVGGTPHLDNQYTVFGEITDGLDVIDLIASQPTGFGDRPEDNIVMKVELIKE